MFYEVHDGPCGVAGVLVILCGKVWFTKDHEQLVLQGRVNGPVIVVQLSLLRVLLEISLLLRGRRPIWDVCHADRVRR